MSLRDCIMPSQAHFPDRHSHRNGAGPQSRGPLDGRAEAELGQSVRRHVQGRRGCGTKCTGQGLAPHPAPVHSFIHPGCSQVASGLGPLAPPDSASHRRAAWKKGGEWGTLGPVPGQCHPQEEGVTLTSYLAGWTGWARALRGK